MELPAPIFAGLPAPRNASGRRRIPRKRRDWKLACARRFRSDGAIRRQAAALRVVVRYREAMSDDPIMSTWPRPRRYTVHDYYRMAEVGLLSPDDRTELIEGEIVDMAPIGPEHAHVVSLLHDLLIRTVEKSVAVRSQLPVRFMPRSEPQPDVALVQSRGEVYRHTHPGAKDVLLLIEVSDSTLRYDLEVKTRLYARHGVPEYWVVDLVNRRVVRFRAPQGRDYTKVDEAREGKLPLPGLAAEISLAELF